MVGAKPSLREIFESKSVAVVGVSPKPGSLASSIVRNLLALEFAGEVYSVGRSGGTLFDRPVFRSVTEIPGPVDLAVIAVPALNVPDVLEECGKKGVRFASITSSGFGEFSTERAGLEQQLLDISNRYAMRFLGPNCQGMRDFETGLSTRFGKQEKQFLPNRAAGLIVQSGTVASTIERHLKVENIGLTRLASIGNKLDVDEADLLPIYLDHEPTKMVFMYLEGIRHGRELFDVAKNSTKPIVLLKGNIAPSTALIARSHSASVLNEQRVTEAAARQAGMILVKQFSECQLVAKAFLLPPMRGSNLVIFGGSGGMDVIGADWAYRTGFDLVRLPAATAASIESKLSGGYIKVGNPVDLGDFFDMRATLTMIEETLALPSVDGMVVCSFDPISPGGHFHNLPERPFAVELKELMFRYDKPIALVYAAERDVIQQASGEAGLPIFAGADEAIRGLEAVRDFWRHRLRAADAIPEPSIDGAAVRKVLDAARAAGRTNLTYAEGFALLAATRIPVEAPRLAASEDDAAAIARALGGTVSMKLVADDSSHKTEIGGVRLNLAGDDAVRTAYRAFRRSHPTTPIALQRMVAGTELMLGARRDPHFGAVVSVGLGGTLVELLQDAALRLAPITRTEATEMLAETRAGRLLEGWRGGSAGDANAVIDALQRLSIVMAEFPVIGEIDVNPLMVLPAGQGVCAVDARVFLEAN